MEPGPRRTCQMIRILRLSVPGSVLAMFICEAALIGISHIAAVYFNPELNPQVFLIDQAGWQSIVVSEGLIIVGMYFPQLYSGLHIRISIFFLHALLIVMSAALLAHS